NFDRDRRFARKTGTEYSYICGGTAYIDDNSIMKTREEGCTTNAVCRATSDSENWVLQGIFKRHEGSIVLREEKLSANVELRKSFSKGMGNAADYRRYCCIENSCVLAFKQSQAADLI